MTAHALPFVERAKNEQGVTLASNIQAPVHVDAPTRVAPIKLATTESVQPIQALITKVASDTKSTVRITTPAQEASHVWEAGSDIRAGLVRVAYNTPETFAQPECGNDDAYYAQLTISQFEQLATQGDKTAANTVRIAKLTKKMEALNNEIGALKEHRTESGNSVLWQYSDLYNAKIKQLVSFTTEARQLISAGAFLRIGNIGEQFNAYKTCRLTPTVYDDIERLVVDYNGAIAMDKQYGIGTSIATLDANKVVLSIIDAQMKDPRIQGMIKYVETLQSARENFMAQARMSGQNIASLDAVQPVSIEMLEKDSSG